MEKKVEMKTRYFEEVVITDKNIIARKGEYQEAKYELLDGNYIKFIPICYYAETDSNGSYYTPCWVQWGYDYTSGSFRNESSRDSYNKLTQRIQGILQKAIKQRTLGIPYYSGSPISGSLTLQMIISKKSVDNLVEIDRVLADTLKFGHKLARRLFKLLKTYIGYLIQAEEEEKNEVLAYMEGKTITKDTSIEDKIEKILNYIDEVLEDE